MLNKPDEEFVKEGAQKVTEKDVEKVINKSEEIQKKFSAKGPLARFIEDGNLLIAIVKDYRARAYRQIPYGVIASIVFTPIYVFVSFIVRFDYWEVRPNELLHHHGMLSDQKRYSAPNLRIDKAINDVFEYLLLGSGRLILQPSGERRAVILDNVLFISRKEGAITQMLGERHTTEDSSGGAGR